jgi:hypothetical protein
MLLDRLREALAHLALQVEHVAFASGGESRQEQARARVAGKHR